MGLLNPDAWEHFEETKEALIRDVHKRLLGVFPPTFNAKVAFSVDSGRVSVHTITLEVRARQGRGGGENRM